MRDFVALFVVPALVLLTTGWLLWRKKHSARAIDLTIWFSVSSLVLTFVVLLAEPFLRSPAVYDHRPVRGIVLACLIAVPGGCIATMVRIKRQKTGLRRALAYAAGPFAYVSYQLLAPSLVTPAEHTRRMLCRTKLRNLVWVIQDQTDDQHQIPPTVIGNPPVSWRVQLLPRLDQVNLFHQYNKATSWNVAPNANLVNAVVSNYQCPSEEYWNGRQRRNAPFYTSYAAAIGPHAILSSEHSSSLIDVSDGLSNTIMLLEACGQGIIWSEPRDIDISQTPLGVNLPGDTPGRSAGVLSSLHPRGAFVAMGDGRVDEMGDHTDPEVLRQLLQRDDGKPVGDF